MLYFDYYYNSCLSFFTDRRDDCDLRAILASIREYCINLKFLNRFYLSNLKYKLCIPNENKILFIYDSIAGGLCYP